MRLLVSAAYSLLCIFQPLWHVTSFLCSVCVDAVERFCPVAHCEKTFGTGFGGIGCLHDVPQELSISKSIL